MTRTLIAALLLPLTGLAGTTTPLFEEIARYPQFAGFAVTSLVEARTGGRFGLFREAQEEDVSHPGGLFRLERDKTQVVHRFNMVDGYNPLTIVTAHDGTIYGTCQVGGEFQAGTVWSFNPKQSVFKKLLDVPLGFSNAAVLGTNPDGSLYGRLTNFGLLKGEYFRCSRAGNLQKLFDFDDLPAAEAGQTNPTNPVTLTLGRDGIYYGTTSDGGPTGQEAGVFFSLNENGDYQRLAVFDASTGLPPTTIVEGPDGAFYGISELATDSTHQPLLLRITKTGEISVVSDFGGLSYASAINRRVFSGPDQVLYIEVSRVTLEEADPADLFARIDVQGQTVEPVYNFTGAQRGALLLLASNGNVYGASRDAENRGVVTRLSGLGFGQLNRAPFALPDQVTLAEGATSVTFNPLRNDGDADSDELTLIEPSEPENGTVTVDSATGRLTYTTEDEDLVSDSFTYTISDESGATATARVRILRAGPSRTYASGLLFNEMPGYCRATITRSGQLTGVLHTLGRKFLLRVSLNEARAGGFVRAVTVPVDDDTAELGPLTVLLEETLPSGSDTTANLEVSLTYAQETFEKTIEEAPLSVDVDPQYSLTIPPFDPLADSEQVADGTDVQITDIPTQRPARLAGAGWMSVQVSDRRNVRLVGKLADGRAVTFGGVFGGEESLPVYITSSPLLPIVPTPPPRGFFAGRLDFSEEENEDAGTQCSGIFRWTRPVGGKGVFKKGFAILQPIAGFRYKRGRDLATQPDEATILPVKLELSAIPGLNAVQSTGTAEGPKFDFAEVNASFTSYGPNGSVTGTVKHPQLPFSSPASGVVIRKFNQIVGFYQTPNGTGQFVIKPE